MPLFQRKSQEQKQAESEARALQEESAAALQRGGIPVQAQRRLQELRSRDDRFFTSDLSVNEFLLAKECRFHPLSQVMGSCIYHVGWQSLPGSWFGGSQELTNISSAWNHARALALGRLRHEAQLVGAHAVIGVHVTRASYEWASDMIEFNTVGTAVRLKDAPPLEQPGLTNLTGQDFWKLYRSGYWPLGVVAGTTVFYVMAGWRTQWAQGSWMNQELQDFSAGVYHARHLAMSHVYEQGRELRCAGIVGMEIEQDEEEREVETSNDTERTDMIFTFHAMGTAITELQGARTAPPIYATINLQP